MLLGPSLHLHCIALASRSVDVARVAVHISKHIHSTIYIHIHISEAARHAARIPRDIPTDHLLGSHILCIWGARNCYT